MLTHIYRWQQRVKQYQCQWALQRQWIQSPICRHICVDTLMNMYIHMYKSIYVYVCMYVFMCVCVCVCISVKCITNIYIYIYMYIFIYIHIVIYLFAYAFSFVGHIFIQTNHVCSSEFILNIYMYTIQRMARRCFFPRLPQSQRFCLLACTALSFPWCFTIRWRLAGYEWAVQFLWRRLLALCFASWWWHTQAYSAFTKRVERKFQACRFWAKRTGQRGRHTRRTGQC